MIAPDVQFRLTANAAAEQYRHPPPYLSYHTVAEIDVPVIKRHKTVERAVETRTADDFAVLQDLPRGQRQYGQSFPLIPTFDALSYFRIDYSSAAHRNLLTHITTFMPLTFGAPRASTAGVAVVATTLRNYYARYAEDSTEAKSHLLLDPLKALTTGNKSDFYLHDLYIDTTTNLPTRVTYTGKDDIEFTLDYVMVENHWLVRHVFFTRTFFAPFRIGRTKIAVNSTFDSFTFPPTPADPKLLPTPAPEPTGPAAPSAPAPKPLPTP